MISGHKESASLVAEAGVGSMVLESMPPMPLDLVTTSYIMRQFCSTQQEALTHAMGTSHVHYRYGSWRNEIV